MAAVRAQFKTAPQGGLFSYLSGRYVRVKREDYLAVLKTTLVQYEREYQELTYVMLDEPVGYVASLEKMLGSANNPNVLMVGRSGTGRQTSLQLAALILKLDVLRLPTVR